MQMSSYSTRSLGDVLDAFAANEPLPGGGSASALAGALGVSLLIMVAGLPRTRSGAPEETADLAEAAARLRPLRETLTALIDRDSDAYRAVISAFRLPKITEDQQARRRDAIQAAFQGATEIPLDTMRACGQALRDAVVVARHGARSATSDVGVAIELLLAALRGSALNVRTNLREVKDQAFVTRADDEQRAIESTGEADARNARTGF
jgi:formiminotetrahydrofolate cyclodeaminase